MSTKRACIKVLSLVAIVAATTLIAKADTLDFTLTGGGNTETFSLSSSPTPDDVEIGAFGMANVPITLNGTDFIANVGFYTTAHGGGMFAPLGDSDAIISGSQLFTGSTASPTFILGDFNLTFGSAPYTLDITDASSSPVPEPASMVLLGTGALAFLGAGRRKFFSR